MVETTEWEQAEQRIDEIVTKSSAVAEAKLSAANALIAEIKHAMKRGTDCIPTATLQEWAVAIPIICEELVPTKEAYSLTKNLWDIETKQLSAKNLLELEEKKTKIDSINKVAGTESSKKRAIAEYLSLMLGSTQESLWSLGNAIRKILDARIACGDCR